MVAGFDWNDLQIFLAVARTGRLTAAARRLRADHATVSRRITSLENALRVKLFDRSPTGYALTGHGERLLLSAQAMESSALSAQSEIAEADRAVSGTVRIGAPEGFGSYFLGPRIGALCQDHPELEVQLVAMASTFSLSKREADIVIALTVPQEGRLIARKLTDYRLGLYAAPAYLRSNPEILGPQDLSGHRLIGYIDDLLYTPELDYLRQIDERIKPMLKSSNLIAQLKASIAGAGLCILPRFIVDDEPGLVAVLPDHVALTRSFWLIIHSDLRGLARVGATADFIVREVRRARSLFLGAPDPARQPLRREAG
jgi:DNA-binding transcriptional LysR family regulator